MSSLAPKHIQYICTGTSSAGQISIQRTQQLCVRACVRACVCVCAYVYA